MSTESEPATGQDVELGLADATMEFVRAFDGWAQKAAQANSGESPARLRLLYELHCNGPRKMADLAETLGVTPRNVTALVDALEGEHQVRRVPHPTDRRVTMIELADPEIAIQRGMEAFRDAVAALFDDVSTDDRE